MPMTRQLTSRDSLEGDRHLDFADPGSVMQLTKSLLKVDFDLILDLPEDKLCPPVSCHDYPMRHLVSC